MSSTLLKYFLQDDVDSFKRLLANVSNAPAGQRSPGGNNTPKIGGSPSYGSSPSTVLRNKKAIGTSPAASLTDRGGYVRGNPSAWSRTQVNVRDQHGRTLLHLVASSPKPTAIGFANALLDLPFVDIYAQDLESGWTALHRALYFGNVAIAHALMQRDLRGAIDFSAPSNTQHPCGSLIKIKDREGNSPFDIYGATIIGRDIKQVVTLGGASVDSLASDNDPSSAENSVYGGDISEDGISSKAQLKPRVNLQADEVFTFGSNKNINLGLGDEDDRHFPERISLSRPDHLLQRFFEEREDARAHQGKHVEHQENLPTLIALKPFSIQDVCMSKMHTAVLTNDPESNLFMTGFGPGGRLGTGDEATRFHFVCIETGGLVGKKVVSLALGQDHSIAISEQGEIFTWGSNKYGQLGYNLPRTNNRRETPIQSIPRQVFNPFKREVILGAAASAIHSVVFSASGLYTFGKNEGQLGLVDSDARSLEIQVTPRRVGVSLFNSPIHMVSAIDTATAVLLETSETWVFTHYGYSRVVFPLDFSSYFIKESFLATRYGNTANRITKITAGGNTICALSTFGEVYSVQVNSRPDNTSITSSTTNPAKIRNSLSTPERVWSVRKSHMAAHDVDVGQDGSIIICTTSGSAWRKEKRTKFKDVSSKDYKFVRISGLSRVTAVRSNAFGAFAAVQKDCDVTKKQIIVSPSSLWNDLFQLLPVKSLSDTVEIDVIGDPTAVRYQIAKMKMAIMSSPDIESQIQRIIRSSDMDKIAHVVWVKTTVSDVRIPVHEFILAGRSLVLRTALAEFQRTNHFSIPDFMTIGLDDNGNTQMLLQGFDFLSLFNLVVFLYTDDVLDVWRDVKHDSVNAYRYRQIRTEIMRIATYLDMRPLEQAARVMGEPSRTLHQDMQKALNDPTFLQSSDVTIRLKDATTRAHSQVLCQRCPFFHALFYGRSGGRWLDSRRQDEAITVDLQDMDPRVFDFVLRHLYGDTEDELFEDVRYDNLDDFVDLVLDVMFAANELMVDRLAQVCQKMLGQFVNTRNVCQLLNAVAPCTVTEFKEAALEYVCLNLEALLENKLLDDLEEDLVDELDEICQENQLARYPVSRGRNSADFLFERYPELVASFETDKQRRIDSMRLSSRRDQDELYDEKIRTGAVDKATPSPSVRKAKIPQSGEPRFFGGSPILKARQSINDLMFQMDDETAVSPSPVRRGKAPMTSSPADDLGDLSQPSILRLSLSQGESLGESSFLEDRIGSLERGLTGHSTSTTPTRHPDSPTPSNLRGVPWVSPVVSGDKRNLRDIMAETSQSRISNLTLGMEDRSSNQSGASFSQKISQRERKRLQQVQVQENLAAQQRAADARLSPWQMVDKKATAKTRENSVEEGIANISKAAQKPAMTLRQTVAGASSTHLDPRPGPSPKSQGRSVSQPIPGLSASTKPIPTNATPAISKTKPSPSLSPISIQPAIQSIRHTPRPERSVPSPASQASLASILLQQQAEKDEIREAATAKHNLQDIQAEQEFQEWWDQESKRVMEAQAAAAAAAQTTKGRQHRRKNRGQQQQQGENQPQQQQQQPKQKQPRQQQKQQQQQRDSDKPAESSRGKPSHRRPPRNVHTPSASTNRAQTVNNQ